MCGNPIFTIASVLFLGTRAVALHAADFFSTNVTSLARFCLAVENTNRPVTILSFGDSMADSYRSPTFHLMNRLQSRLGVAGYSLNNYQNQALAHFTNGAGSILPAPELWFYPIAGVPSGGAVWWEHDPNIGIQADQVGLFWIAHPQGGAMRLLVSTNDGAWSSKLLLEGYSPMPSGHYTNISLASNNYRLRVESVTGTNLIIGPQTFLRQSRGVHSAFIEFGGVHLGQVTNVRAAVRNPIFAALKPDLLIWHMKEPEDLSTSNRMEMLEASWQSIMPNCDVAYLGTPWTFRDSEGLSSPFTPVQNSMVRSVALRNHRAYVDLMTPAISYAWLVGQGYMADEVHLNSAGGAFCANIIWNDLRFFALGLDRHLSLNRYDDELQISYKTSPHACYRLEASTNLTNWSVLVTNLSGNGTFITNLPGSSFRLFYRMGLEPP